jgi:hypothetical protein
MTAKENAIEMLNVKQCIKEVQAKINYCVQLNEKMEMKVLITGMM